MTTSPTSATSEKFGNRSRLDANDVEYFRQRNRERLYAAVMTAFSKCIEERGLTKAHLARILHKNPSQITRWLGGPSNWTIDNISLFLLACGAEMDYCPSFLANEAIHNDQHSLVDELDNRPGSVTTLQDFRRTQEVEQTETKKCY